MKILELSNGLLLELTIAYAVVASVIYLLNRLETRIDQKLNAQTTPESIASFNPEAPESNPSTPDLAILASAAIAAVHQFRNEHEGLQNSNPK